MKQHILFISLLQKLFGQCINNAPVGFLKNFETTCVSLLHACPTAAPFRMLASDLRKTVKSGEGSMFYLINMWLEYLKALQTLYILVF